MRTHSESISSPHFRQRSHADFSASRRAMSSSRMTSSGHVGQRTSQPAPSRQYRHTGRSQPTHRRYAKQLQRKQRLARHRNSPGMRVQVRLPGGFTECAGLDDCQCCRVKCNAHVAVQRGRRPSTDGGREKLRPPSAGLVGKQVRWEAIADAELAAPRQPSQRVLGPTGCGSCRRQYGVGYGRPSSAQNLTGPRSGVRGVRCWTRVLQDQSFQNQALIGLSGMVSPVVSRACT